ncbi:MAG: restriction endonuclease subunit S [Chitinophagaceae bacterium]|nr:restriction endonuclease subunit S [Chitinophagaceae bacterium]
MIAVATENKNTVWHGEFPSHWEVLRIKNLFQEMENRSETGSEELLSVSHYTGVTLKRDSLENEDDHLTNAESLVGYKLVAKNDLVINIMLAWNGSLGISPYHGITSPAYCVYRIKGENNPEYFGYLFSTAMFKAEFRRNSTGIIDSRLRLYSNKFFSIFSVVPPKEEQDEIVSHIKIQSEKINQFIQKKKHFIELLKEQRQTIITNAITKGVDENIETKFSGVEWLGNVPKHWKVIRLKFVGESFIGLTYSPLDLVDKEDGVFVLRSSNIQNGKFATEDNVYVNKEIPEKLILKKGDILLCSRNGSAELIGKNILIDEETEGNSFGAFMTVFRSHLNYYLYYFFNSSIFKSQTSLFATSTINQLTNGILNNLKIAYSENIDEQERIIEHIKTETATIDTAISKAEREIELIKEYKEAMISEAVIGKLDLKQA